MIEITFTLIIIKVTIYEMISFIKNLDKIESWSGWFWINSDNDELIKTESELSKTPLFTVRYCLHVLAIKWSGSKLYFCCTSEKFTGALKTHFESRTQPNIVYLSVEIIAVLFGYCWSIYLSFMTFVIILHTTLFYNSL